MSDHIKAIYRLCHVDNFVQKFISDIRGQFAVVFALLVLGLITSTAAVVDLVGMSSAKVKIQNLMDSSVLAGIDSTKSDVEQKKIAKKVFKKGYKNIFGKKTLGYNTRFKFDGDYLIGNVTVDYKTIFAWPLGSESFPIKVASTATEGAGGRGPVCIMTMHPTRAHTLEMKDRVSLLAPDCHIYGNSNNVEDVVDLHSPENFMVGKSVQAIGYGHHFIENVSPPLSHAPELIPDPFLSMLIPKAGSVCVANNLEISGNNAMLAPGTYCGGLNANSGATVRLKKGIYVFTGGDFTIEGSTLIGKGATIVLKDKTEIIWEDSIIKLEAPKTGPYASIALMGDRINVEHEIVESGIDIHGVVYLPNGEFEWTNTGIPETTALWTVWIVDGFSWDGDGEINIPFKPELSNIPFPAKLNNIIPSINTSARLVK